jgi:hypothetical protein
MSEFCDEGRSSRALLAIPSGRSARRAFTWTLYHIGSARAVGAGESAATAHYYLVKFEKEAMAEIGKPIKQIEVNPERLPVPSPLPALPAPIQVPA